MRPTRLARVAHDGRTRWARIADGHAELLVAADFGAALSEAGAGAVVPLAHVRFLPPFPESARLFCVGRNYRDHAAEMGSAPPEWPSLFHRLYGSMVGHGAGLRHPAVSERYDFEGEIAVVLRHGGWRLTAAEAQAAIGGVTLVMDGSVRDFQAHSLLAGKNFRQSGSAGPWIVPVAQVGALDALTVETRLNDMRVQYGSLGDLIHDPAALIAYLSTILELAAGDIISTGTPAGVGQARTPPLWLRPGDRISVTCPQIGILENQVFAGTEIDFRK